MFIKLYVGSIEVYFIDKVEELNIFFLGIILYIENELNLLEYSFGFLEYNFFDFEISD